VLTNGGPGHATEVITTYVYELYGSGKYGVSTALSSLLLAVSAVVGFLIVKQMRTKEEDAA
jgi:raffinose/stachyose/melibiose transport system permease protein